MSTRKTTQSRPIQSTLILWTVAVLAKLPYRLARLIGHAAGLASSFIPTREHRVTARNIDWCFPEWKEQERRKLIRSSLVEDGRNLFESGAVLKWPLARLKELEVEAEGEELLRAAVSSGRGAILLLPHLGNWEMLMPFLTPRYPFVSLYRPPKLRGLERFLVESRERFASCEMVASGPGGLKKLYRSLEEGRLIIILPDQEPVERSGVFAPFFGVPALTMTLVQRLTRKLGCPSVFAWPHRTAEGRFRVRFREPPEGLGDPDPIVAATRLNEGVESCVRTCPEQYTWSYKRFRTRPPIEVATRELGHFY